jgi:hypothetical protein
MPLASVLHWYFGFGVYCFDAANDSVPGLLQIRIICMFIEMNHKKEGTTPAGVECRVNVDISINI